MWKRKGAISTIKSHDCVQGYDITGTLLLKWSPSWTVPKMDEMSNSKVIMHTKSMVMGALEGIYKKDAIRNTWVTLLCPLLGNHAYQNLFIRLEPYSYAVIQPALWFFYNFYRISIPFLQLQLPLCSKWLPICEKKSLLQFFNYTQYPTFFSCQERKYIFNKEVSVRNMSCSQRRYQVLGSIFVCLYTNNIHLEGVSQQENSLCLHY